MNDLVHPALEAAAPDGYAASPEADSRGEGVTVRTGRLAPVTFYFTGVGP